MSVPLPPPSEDPEVSADAVRKVRDVVRMARLLVDIPHGRRVCAHCVGNRILKAVAPIPEYPKDQEVST